MTQRRGKLMLRRQRWLAVVMVTRSRSPYVSQVLASESRSSFVWRIGYFGVFYGMKLCRGGIIWPIVRYFVVL